MASLRRFYAVTASLFLLTGCSNSLTEDQVQVKIDKAIAGLKSELRAEFSGRAPAAELGSSNFSSSAPIARQNKEVDEYLNKADLYFRDDDEKNSCHYVSMAIDSASDGVSGDQASQLRGYAQRCRLRY